jgi:hypothetical protein
MTTSGEPLGLAARLADRRSSGRAHPHGMKWTYVTRRVMPGLSTLVGPRVHDPRSGDLVVCRVTRIGAHDHCEDRWGRHVRLWPGDLLVGALGNRYATDFYEGYVPRGSRTHLLTAGGLIGDVLAAHDAHVVPTELEVIGAVVDDDMRPLSTEDFAAPTPPPARPRHATIAVVGSGMNAGKTTTAAAIVRGCAQAGLRVGAGKVTGSGSGKDRWSYIDSGAHSVADFLDFGMPSTFGYPLERLVDTMFAIRDTLAADGAGVVVLEIADGLLMPETSGLLERLGGIADSVVLAAVDALSARSGVEILRGLGLPVHVLSGLVSRSPLASREATETTGLPVLTPKALAASAALELLGASTNTAA